MTDFGQTTKRRGVVQFCAAAVLCGMASVGNAGVWEVFRDHCITLAEQGGIVLPAALPKEGIYTFDGGSMARYLLEGGDVRLDVSDDPTRWCGAVELYKRDAPHAAAVNGFLDWASQPETLDRYYRIKVAPDDPMFGTYTDGTPLVLRGVDGHVVWMNAQSKYYGVAFKIMAPDGTQG